jgi:hypothetical protein
MASQPNKANTTSRPKRRWFRYSLRTFFVFVTAICLLVGLKIVPFLYQRQAINSFKGNGYFPIPYQYEYQLDYYNGHEPKGKPPPEPAWSERVFGADIAHDVVKVQLFEKGFDNRADFQQAVSNLRYLTSLRFLDVDSPNYLQGGELESLKNLKGLQELHLTHDQLDDNELQNLKNLKQLKTLALMWNRIGGEGLVHLEQLDNLQTLDLYENNIGDAALIHLGKLTNLEDLCLEKNRLTGSGLQYLSGLTKLKTLTLSKNDIHGEYLKHLASLNELQFLTLDDNPLENEHLKEIVKLPNLAELSLVRTKLTDECIESLEELPAGCAIVLTGTKLTPNGLRNLSRARPQSTIYIQGEFDGYDPSAVEAVPYAPKSD